MKNTIPSYHITKSSKINLFQRKQNGSSPQDHKQIIKYKKLRVSDNNNSDLACFSTICDKLELSPTISEQCYRLYQKLKDQYPKFTRAKSVCLSLYLVCRKNTIPYDEQNLRNIVCQTLGVKNAPKFKSVIFKITKNLQSDLGVNEDEISSFYSSTSEYKEKFYLNLHISQTQKRLKLTDVSDMKRLTLQYYDDLSRFYANDNSKIVQSDYNTKAKRAVSLALQRCVITA
ncbi:hypothetical protein [Nitrosopumilus sp.]|uniref:hypothetical protein n=1 Tax=Nitrosopumilus sp. TaxID=2024843 RepID=UPI00292E9DF2|nr:hypothetical protein [Nitrosopumilus sp.]